MSLAALVSREKWTEFEDAWTNHMLEDGPLDAVHEAIRLAADKKQMQRCVPLVREHSDLLRGAGRHADAAHLLGTVLLQGGNPGELGGLLLECAREAWKGETWFEAYAAIAGLRDGAPDVRAAWRSFERCKAMIPGAAVFHSKGWGIGLVTELEGSEVVVRFKSGRSDRFPLTSAVDIFEVLPADDLRSLVMHDPDELSRLVREEPLDVLKSVLLRFRGKAAYPVIKGALSQLGVDGTSFNGWWRKARKQAESSPWFDITGTSTKVQVQILATASDPAESVQRSLRLVGDLAKVLTRVRDLLAGGHVDEGVREAALVTIEELAKAESAPLPARLGAWMLLRDQRGETPAPLRQRVLLAANIPLPSDPSQPPALWSLFADFTNARDQERCVAILAEVYPDPERRTAEILRHLQHAAPGMVRMLVAELLEGGRTAELSEHYTALLSRPTRNPHLLVALAELAENERLRGDLPIPAHRIQSLVRLAVYLEAGRIRNPTLQRAQQRLTSVLTSGSSSVLRRLLAGSDVAVLRSTLNFAARGIDAPLENELVSIVAELAPEIFRDLEKPFWETGLWTTRAGLERRRAELRELTEVKLPANSEAIGKAAAFGDLSENSEWESAIAEQRTLTQRAQEIEAELRSAKLIEEASLPPETAAPGTTVRYRDLRTREVHTVTILGPWDTQDDDSVISYRAPVAAGLLGLRAGMHGTLVIPSGEVEVEVLAVETLVL